MNIFERAARAKLRFPSAKGNLTTEQLFDLSLPQLDVIARKVNALLKAEGEESFIETKTSAVQTTLKLQLEILKAVIDAKQKAAKAAETRAENASRKRRLEEALANKRDEALSSMSEEELKAELEKLSS